MLHNVSPSKDVSLMSWQFYGKGITRNTIEERRSCVCQKLNVKCQIDAFECKRTLIVEIYSYIHCWQIWKTILTHRI